MSEDEFNKLKDVVNRVPTVATPGRDKPTDGLKFLRVLEQRLRDDGLWTADVEQRVDKYRQAKLDRLINDITTETVKSCVETKDRNLLNMIMTTRSTSSTYDTAFYHKLRKTASSADRHAYLKEHDEEFTKQLNRHNFYDGVRALKALKRCLAAYLKSNMNDEDAEVYMLRLSKVLDKMTSSSLAKTVLQNKLTVSQRKVVGRAQRRQLLMLLVGDVPGDLFVDPRTGYVRSGVQISHYILDLLGPYNMSTTTPGSYLHKINKWVNLVRSYSAQAMKLVTYGVTALFQWVLMVYSAILFLTSYSPQWLTQYAWTGLVSIFATCVRMLVGMLVTVVERTGTERATALRGFQGYFAGVSQTMKSAYEMKGAKTLMTKGIQLLMLGVVGKLLLSIKLDCGRNRSCSVMWYSLQQLTDRYQIFQACTYLAELEPGVLGDHTVSGISDAQMGTMEDVQKIHGELDLYVENVTPRALTLLMTRFQDTEQSQLRQKLWLALQEVMHMSQTHRIEPRAVRQTLLHSKRGFSHEIRGHHLFDQYGYPRRSLDIAKAYFCDWHRQQEQGIHKMPTVPYNSSTLHQLVDTREWDMENGGVKRGKILTPGLLNLNPIARAEFNRQHHSNPEVRQRTVVTDDVTDWVHAKEEREALVQRDTEAALRNKININQVFKNEGNVHFSSWLESVLPNNPEARDEMRKYSGWTHKLSTPLKKKLIAEFSVKLDTIEEDYSAFLERMAESEDRDKDFKRPTARRTPGHRDGDPRRMQWTSKMDHLFVFDGTVHRVDAMGDTTEERIFSSPSEMSEEYREFVDKVWDRLGKRSGGGAAGAATTAHGQLYDLYQALYEGNPQTIPHLNELVSMYGDPTTKKANQIQTDNNPAKACLTSVVYLASMFLIADHKYRVHCEWFNRNANTEYASEEQKNYAIQQARRVFRRDEDWNGKAIWDKFEEFVDTVSLGDLIMKEWHMKRMRGDKNKQTGGTRKQRGARGGRRTQQRPGRV